MPTSTYRPGVISVESTSSPRTLDEVSGHVIRTSPTTSSFITGAVRNREAIKGLRATWNRWFTRTASRTPVAKTGAVLRPSPQIVVPSSAAAPDPDIDIMHTGAEYAFIQVKWASGGYAAPNYSAWIKIRNQVDIDLPGESTDLGRFVVQRGLSAADNAVIARATGTSASEFIAEFEDDE